MKYPLRLGRKQQRAVLDADGIEVVVFPKGKEELALKMVELFNKNENLVKDIEYHLNQKPKIDFETQKGRFTFIKTESKNIPANKNEFAKLHLKEYGFDVIGFTDELTEEQWSEVVNKSENYNYSFNDYMWKDYTDITGWRGFKTATESGQSLMESLNLEKGNWLLIKYT